jgi:hypothetical protein
MPPSACWLCADHDILVVYASSPQRRPHHHAGLTSPSHRMDDSCSMRFFDPLAGSVFCTSSTSRGQYHVYARSAVRDPRRHPPSFRFPSIQMLVIHQTHYCCCFICSAGSAFSSGESQWQIGRVLRCSHRVSAVCGKIMEGDRWASKLQLTTDNTYHSAFLSYPSTTTRRFWDIVDSSPGGLFELQPVTASSSKVKDKEDGVHLTPT